MGGQGPDITASLHRRATSRLLPRSSRSAHNPTNSERLSSVPVRIGGSVSLSALRKRNASPQRSAGTCRKESRIVYSLTVTHRASLPSITTGVSLPFSATPRSYPWSGSRATMAGQYCPDVGPAV